MKVQIEVLSGELKGKRFILENGNYLIGRGEQVDIQILSHQLSRMHAEIVVTDQQVRVLDKGSANGTAVNGTFISSQVLKNGDQLSLGDTVLEITGIPKSMEQRPKTQSNPELRPSGVYRAATKVISDRLRPRALWPLFTLVLAVAFLGVTLLFGYSYRQVLHEKLYQLSMNRAYDLVRLLAERNREDLKYEHNLLLDTDSIAKERGVIQALVLNKDAKIVSPLTKLNQFDPDPLIAEALVASKDARIIPAQIPGKQHYVFVHPIRAFNDTKGQYQIYGVAKIIFDPEQATGGLPEANQLLMLMMITSLAISVFLGWLLSKWLTQPISKLSEKIHQWRTGHMFERESAPYQEWAPLYEAVDRALEEADNS